MDERLTAKVLVVGGGPGGYAAAIRAGQLGLQTVLVEGDRLGGTCLIRGCIPSKALIHLAEKFHDAQKWVGKRTGGIFLVQPPVLDMEGAIAWKDSIVDKLNGGIRGLVKKAGVQIVQGWATFSDAKTCIISRTGAASLMVEAEHVILATGSQAAELPNLPFGADIVSSAEALSFAKLPKSLAVIGAGYIGLELGIAYRKMGAKVTLIEASSQILPAYDSQLVDPVRKALERLGIALHVNCRVRSADAAKSGVVLKVMPADGAEIAIPADKVLVTVGRKPHVDGWGRENMALDLDGWFIKVDKQCRTSMRNVWAIGDLVGEPMLAHKASAQGVMVAEIIAGKRSEFSPAAIPAVCFTDPEIVSVGLTRSEAAKCGVELVEGVFPFAASGRAMTLDDAASDGFVQVLARLDNQRVLGIHAVGAHISELSGEFVHAVEMASTLEDVAAMIHAHPTLSEAFGEAASRALGHAIHI